MEEVKNKTEQATPGEESESYLTSKSIEKINLHCHVMEKCLAGSCTVIERILAGDKMDKFGSDSNFNQYGSEEPDFPKPLVLANAIIVGSKVYEKVIDEIEKETIEE